MSDNIRKRIFQEYNYVFEEYYYAGMLLYNLFVQTSRKHHLSEREKYEILRKQFKANFFLEYIQKSYFIYLKLFARRRNPAILINLHKRFFRFKEAIFSFSKKDKNYTLYDCDIISNKLKLNLFTVKINKILNNKSFNSIDQLIKNKRSMIELDNLVYRNLLRMSVIFKIIKINTIFLSDSLNIKNFLISVAAKFNNIPCYWMPHGYPQTEIYYPFLYSERILFWNQHQVNKYTSHIQIDKIKITGYLGYDRHYINDFINKNDLVQDPKKILIATTRSSLEEKKHLYAKLSFLRRSGYRVCVRLHGKEKKSKFFSVTKDLITSFGFEISDINLLEDIVTSNLVIGYGTSVVYEAKMISNNGIQITDFMWNDKPFFFEVPYIPLSDINFLLNKEKLNNIFNEIPDNDLVFNFEDIIGKLVN